MDEKFFDETKCMGCGAPVTPEQSLICDACNNAPDGMKKLLEGTMFLTKPVDQLTARRVINAMRGGRKRPGTTT